MSSKKKTKAKTKAKTNNTPQGQTDVKKQEEAGKEVTKPAETKPEVTNKEEAGKEVTKPAETKPEATNKEEVGKDVTKPAEEKTESANKKEESVDKQKKPEKKQEVVEWKEREQEKDVVQEDGATEKKKAHQFGMFLLVLMGIILAATVFVLAVCLYDTSKDLKTVQTMSGSLQSEIELAKQKVEQVEKLLEEVEADYEAVAKNASDEAVAESGDVKAKPTATPRPTPEPEVYTVCVDAGHGGYDTGATLWTDEETERREKDDNLRMAELLKKELEAYGVKVIMTREDDTFLELYDRTFIANSLDADALISLHRNAYYLNGKMNDRVSGVEIWVHNSRPADAMQLAGEMLGAMMEVGGMKNRGVKYGSMSDVNENYAINRRALMTSMIVELGFISNEEDNAALDTYGEAYAKAMATEIYEWLQTLR
ncbi:MAG: N-acetylmuramoyl-L-alanine amidase [Lachnospiraceae bacterium]|nr:N-acetylmuramoyl-L-alanine amidase [Lachnospiraceae bacterium]